jgi:hypothetical protein
MTRSLMVLACLVAPLFACGNDTTINIDNYDRSCTVDTDCVAVLVGDVCGECGGTYGAINTSDEAREQADYDALYSSCPPPKVECGAPSAGELATFCNASHECEMKDAQTD